MKIFYVEDGTLEFFNNKFLILSSSVIKKENLAKEKIIEMLEESRSLIQNPEIRDKQKYMS